MTQKIYFVAGISSAGKSTYIETQLQAETGAHESSIKFAGALSRSFDLGPEPVCIVHYNLLLQIYQRPDIAQTVLLEEPVYARMVAMADQVEVVLIYATDQILRDRIAVRTHVEPRYGNRSANYPAQRFLADLKRVNQAALLLEIHQTFTALGRPVRLLEARDGLFLPMRVQDLSERQAVP